MKTFIPQKKIGAEKYLDADLFILVIAYATCLPFSSSKRFGGSMLFAFSKPRANSFGIPICCG